MDLLFDCVDVEKAISLSAAYKRIEITCDFYNHFHPLQESDQCYEFQHMFRFSEETL